MSFFSKTIAAAALVALPAVASAAPVVIDTFATAQGPVSVTGPAGSTDDDTIAFPAGAIGDRTIFVEKLNDTPFSSTSGQVFGSPAEVFILANNSVVETARGSAALIYDNMGGVPMGTVDLTGGGMNTVFGIDLLSTDLPLTIEIKLTDDMGDMLTESLSFAGGASGEFLLPYALFDGSADLTAIAEIAVTLIGDVPGTDASIALLQSTRVPLPAPAALLLTGLVGLAVMRRRRKAATA